MIRRLAAALLALSLAACSDKPARAPEPAAPAAKAPLAAPAPLAYASTASPTLAAVRKRGRLNCGVHPGLPGFAYPDTQRRWRGFDVDVCRAVAAATLGDAAKVAFVPVTPQDRFNALRDGRIDVLSRNTSWTLARDAGLGLDFAAVTYYDGQGFLVPRVLGLTSAEELSGAKICVQSGTASETNLAEWFKARGLKVKPVLVASEPQARAAYQDEQCDAFTADVSALAASRSVLNNPGAHVILPDVISKEPLGPVVRQGDPAWTDIVRWTVFALVDAEELGVSSKNIDALRASSTDPEVRRLLGVDGGLGPMLGLSDDWAYRAVKQVGAYDEVFRRNVGAGSALRLERGMNALWKGPNPGQMYAPPIR